MWHTLSRMATPFAVEVASAGFLASARGWISSALDAAGIGAIGPSDQVRVRPWSTQLVTPTTQGRIWFKANCTGLTHEAALHAELARIGAVSSIRRSRSTLGTVGCLPATAARPSLSAAS